MRKEKILEIINNVAEELEYMIYDSSIYLKGENSSIRVIIDKLEGIAHSDCEIYSKRLDQILQFEDILPNYTLEVSSPGLKRKLRNMEEIKRFVGSPVKIVYYSDDIKKVIKGILQKVNEEKIEVLSDNRKLFLDYNNIVNAQLDY